MKEKSILEEKLIEKENELNELNKELSKKNKEIEKLKQGNNENDDKLEENLRKLIEVEGERNELLYSSNEIKREIDILNKENEKIKKNSEKIIEDKEDQIEMLEKEIKSKDNCLNAWKEKFEKQLKDTTNLKKLSQKNEENIILQNKLNQKNFEINEFSIKLHDKINENKKFKNDFNKIIEEKDEIIINNENSINKLTTKLEFITLENNAKEKELDFYQKIHSKKNNNKNLKNINKENSPLLEKGKEIINFKELIENYKEILNTENVPDLEILFQEDCEPSIMIGRNLLLKLETERLRSIIEKKHMIIFDLQEKLMEAIKNKENLTRINNYKIYELETILISNEKLLNNWKKQYLSSNILINNKPIFDLQNKINLLSFNNENLSIRNFNLNKELNTIKGILTNVYNESNINLRNSELRIIKLTNHISSLNIQLKCNNQEKGGIINNNNNISCNKKSTYCYSPVIIRKTFSPSRIYENNNFYSPPLALRSGEKNKPLFFNRILNESRRVSASPVSEFNEEKKNIYRKNLMKSEGFDNNLLVSLKNQVEELKKELALCQEESFTIKEESDFLKMDFANVTKNWKKYEEKNKELLNEIAELNLKIEKNCLEKVENKKKFIKEIDEAVKITENVKKAEWENVILNNHHKNQREISQFVTQVNILEKKLSNSEQKINDLKNHYQKLLTENDESFTYEERNLKKENFNILNKNNELKNDFNILEFEINALKEQKNDLEKIINEQKIALEKNCNDKINYIKCRKDFDNEIKINKELKKNIIELNSRLENLQAEYNSKTKKSEEITKEKDLEIANLIKELKFTIEDNSEKKEINELKEKEEKLEKLLDSFKEENHELKVKSKKNENFINEQKDCLKEWKNKYLDKENECLNLRNDNLICYEDMENIIGELSLLKNLNNEINNEKENAIEKMNNMEIKLIESLGNIKTSTEDIAIVKLEKEMKIDNLIKQIEALKKFNENIEEESNNLTNRIDLVSNEKREIEKYYEEEIKICKVIAEEFKDKFNKEIEYKNNKIESLIKEIDQICQNLQLVDEKNKWLEQKYEEFKKKAEVLVEQNVQLNDRLEEVVSKNHGLIQNLDFVKLNCRKEKEREIKSLKEEIYYEKNGVRQEGLKYEAKFKELELKYSLFAEENEKLQKAFKDACMEIQILKTDNERREKNLNCEIDKKVFENQNKFNLILVIIIFCYIPFFL